MLPCYSVITFRPVLVLCRHLESVVTHHFIAACLFDTLPVPVLRFQTSNAAGGAAAQQQAAPLLNNNHNNHPHPPNMMWATVRGLGSILASLLKILLWPVRQLTAVLFPFCDTDGLAAAVTAKAAQQCIHYLRSLAVAAGVSAVVVGVAPPQQHQHQQNQNAVSMNIANAWSSTGFAALKQQAVTTQSLILVYLHSPLHSESRKFCTTVLNQEPFLSWLLLQQRENRVLATAYSIHTAQGAQLQGMLQVTAFPAIAVLQPLGTTGSSSSTLQLVLKAQGMQQCSVHTIMPQLHAVQQRHQTVLTELEVRRMLRQQESDLRQQQDEEYQETLAADQERERAVAAERNAILAAAAAEQEAQRRQEQAASDALQAAKDLILPEPPLVANGDGGGATGCTVIRFCLPTGAKINRRFASHQTVAAVKAFLKVYFTEHQIQITNVALSTNFPRKTYHEDDDNLSLEAAGLAPQAVLMVQDLDA